MAKKKILIVYPEFPLTFWSFKKSVEFLGKRGVMTPTGAATVAAMHPSDQYDVKIVDMNVRHLEDRDIKWADLVEVSAMNVQEKSGRIVVERVHSLGKKVAEGGPFASTYPDRCTADYIIAGEAELTLKPFLEDLAAGHPRREYTEKYILDSGRFDKDSVVFSKDKSGNVTIKPVLNHTPIPRWDLLELNKYATASAQFSRGCPHRCDFCLEWKLFGGHSRTETPSQFIAELDDLYNRGFRGGVFVLDDNFIGNAHNVRKLLPVLEQWQRERDFPFSFFTEASLDLAWDKNKDILEGMVAAGFDEVFLGYESPDPDTCGAMNKVQNTKLDPLEATRRIQRAGIIPTGGFIMGTDGDKPTVAQDLFRFIQKAGIPTAMTALLTAFRGTDLYDRLEREGRILSESEGDNVQHLGFNFKTKLPEKDLIEGYSRLLSQLSEPKNYYDRCRVLFDNLGPGISRRHIGAKEISAFFKSVGRQLFAQGGLEYAKFLGDTLIRHPERFPTAVKYAIQLTHFRQITDAALSVPRYKEHTENLYERFKSFAEEFSASHLSGARIKINEAEAKLKDYASALASKARKKYNNIHPDFRSDVSGVYNNLVDRLSHEVEMFKTRHSQKA